MKKLIVLGIIATMVMGMAVAASAAVDSAWLVTIKAFNTADNQSGSQIQAGTKLGAIDAFTESASEDGVGPLQPSGLATIYSAVVPISERCTKDQRAPMLVGETKVWNLYTSIQSQTTGTIRLDMWVANIIDPSTDGDPDLLVQLFKGSELIWTAPYGVKSTSQAPMFSYVVDYGTELQLVASAIVPEPGSMVALFSGLVGLVGFGIRRRK